MGMGDHGYRAEPIPISNVHTKLTGVIEDLTEIVEKLKDKYTTRNFDDGLRRCSELGVRDIEFTIQANYVVDRSKEFLYPFYLTNANVLCDAKRDGETIFKFRIPYAAHECEQLRYNTLIRSSKGVSEGEERLREFLTDKFISYVDSLLSSNGLTYKLKVVSLREKPLHRHNKDFRSYLCSGR